MLGVVSKWIVNEDEKRLSRSRIIYSANFMQR